MPVNRNALIRYRTIDNCLRNRFRKWTLDDLIDACSEALYEYEGIDKGVSKRTVQMDIQLMRSDKLGYYAPIVVTNKKYYTYEDPDYSITNIPLTDQDLLKLNEVVEILKQFKGFTHFQELSGMVQKLEDKIHTAKTDQESVIDFEKNENLKGLEHLDMIYESILKKKPLQMTYQSFRARKSNTFVLFPYLLKEYRNRWFVLGNKQGFPDISTLALDRIVALEKSYEKFQAIDVDMSNYFKNVIGVTVNANQQTIQVILRVNRRSAPYVITKPMHHSQQVIDKGEEGITISLEVQHNFELEREILGFGETMIVLEPEFLRNRIQNRLKYNLKLYEEEIGE